MVRVHENWMRRPVIEDNIFRYLFGVDFSFLFLSLWMEKLV
jgi:hypothetical protein